MHIIGTGTRTYVYPQRYDEVAGIEANLEGNTS